MFALGAMNTDFCWVCVKPKWCCDCRPAVTR